MKVFRGLGLEEGVLMSKNNEKQNIENLLKKGSLKNKIIFEMGNFMF